MANFTIMAGPQVAPQLPHLQEPRSVEALAFKDPEERMQAPQTDVQRVAVDLDKAGEQLSNLIQGRHR